MSLIIKHRHWRFESEGRYYKIFLHQDLWGSWHLTRAWGGKNSNRGGMRIDSFSDAREIEKAINDITTRRLQRGYKLIDEK